jgi:hypothetical protein
MVLAGVGGYLASNHGKGYIWSSQGLTIGKHGLLEP